MTLHTYKINADIADDLFTVHTLMGRGTALIRKSDTGDVYIDTWLPEDDLRLLTAYAVAVHDYLSRKEQGVALWVYPARAYWNPDFDLAMTHLGIDCYGFMPTDPLDEIIYIGETEDYRDLLDEFNHDSLGN